MMNTTLSPLLASSGASPGFLIVESGSLAGQRFPLPQAPGALLLGRERLCNVRFDPERDRVVGRTHARLEVRSDGIFLTDLNSANGTFRSDGSAVRGEVRLSPGDRFQLGGEGGPWLSLQTDVAKVAVHVVPPAAEMPTLVMSPSPPVAAASPWPTPAAPPALQPPPIDVPPSPPAPIPQRGVAGTYPMPGRDQEPLRRPEPVPADPVALQQRTEYRRQIVAIALLLIVACAVGLALGLRGPSVEDDVETVYSE